MSANLSLLRMSASIVADVGESNFNFVGLNKKKRKKPMGTDFLDNTGEHLHGDSDGDQGDYKYEELLGTPLQVLREGTRKTVFANFMDLCKTMHRQADHVMTFFLGELGTSGTTDGQQRLVVKGRFAPKNFKSILRKYISVYVICDGCKSPDTILSEESRLFFLRCEQCGSLRSVAPIKIFARVGCRKAGA